MFERDRPALAALTVRSVERLGRGMDNWASVDAFACTVAGPAWNLGALRDATVHKWARSRDVWWRRAALASTVALNLKSRGGSGDPARTFAVCKALVDDREDMVVKAMSWALRSVVEHDAPAVRRFLDEHDLAPRVVREVTRKLVTGRKN